MFCRNCGKELTGAAQMCPNCGAMAISGTSFCPACGAATAPLAELCPNCGVQLAKATRQKAWRTRAAGILAIVAGALGLAQFVTVAVVEIHYLDWSALADLLRTSGIITATVAIVITTGIVAIVGGSFALKRRRWRLALAGSICAMFCVIFVPILLNVPLAIAAIVLVVLGKGQFEQRSRLGKSRESDSKEL